MNRLKFMMFTLLMLVYVTVAGQSVKDTIHIKEVRVLASKRAEESGLKITRPDSLQRVSTLTTDLAELISDYSPVFIKSYGRGSSATASFRGTAATHTQVLWNGINLNSPMRGMADLSLLPVFFTDDVYLLHGGSSMSKGSGALGGSIHLENIPDWNSSFNLEGLAETGSFLSRKTFLKIQFGNKKFQSSTRLFYDASENNFSFYNSGVIPKKNDTLKNADYNKAGILQEFYYRHNKDQISGLRLWYQKSSRNLPQLMSYQGSEKEEFQSDGQFRAQYDWKKYSEKGNMRFFSGLNTARLHYYRATPAFEFVNEDSRSNELSWTNHFEIYRQLSEKTFFTAAADFNRHNVRASDRQTDTGYNKNRTETGLMLNFQYKPSGRFAAFALFRSESYDRKIVPLIPSAGLEWQIFNGFPLLLRSGLARNYHKPALNDLYWLPGGNSQLLPEDGYTADISLGSDLKSDNFSFKNEITGFISKIENWIMWQPAQNGAYYWEAGNVKDVLSRGAEYSYTAAVKLGKVSFRSGGNYSFTATSNLNAVRSADQSRGKQLIYIPKHKGGFYAGIAWQKFTLKYDLNGVGRRYTKSDNTESNFEQVLNPYWLSRLSAGRQIEIKNIRAELKLTTENLFNQNYQSILWRPMPGRHYTFSVAIKYRKE